MKRKLIKPLLSAAENAVAKAGGPFFKVTLIRSLIGVPEKTRIIVRSLGLGKTNSEVWVPVSPTFAGTILKVKELVDVEQVGEVPEYRRPRRPAGYAVIGSHMPPEIDMKTLLISAPASTTASTASDPTAEKATSSSWLSSSAWFSNSSSPKA